jgi:sugar diacid utilization regulator
MLERHAPVVMERPAVGLRRPAGRPPEPEPRRPAPEPRRPAARAYWPCLLGWVEGRPSESTLGEMRRAAHRWDRRCILVPVGRSRQLLLVPDDRPEAGDRGEARAAVARVIEAVGRRGLGPPIRTIVGDRIKRGDPVPVVTARLRRLGRYALPEDGDTVLWARRRSFDSLLETLDRGQAAAFVEVQLGGLRAYDHEHGTNLQRVLELALDHHNRNDAALAAFMHRNTFRRQLRKALELIDLDLDCPEERLALHLALKISSSRGAP